MNRVILCEGMTDAVLLSYYLGKVAGWDFCKKAPQGVDIKPDDRIGQSANWYKKGDERLLICGVGGKDRMGSFFNDYLLHPMVVSNSFSRFAVVLDRDDRGTDSLESHASSIFNPIITSMKNSDWVKNSYKDSYGEKQVLETLLVIIPTEHQGALETLMLDSIAEDPYASVIVDEAGRFVKSMRQELSPKYLKTKRDELKAHLGVTWAIQYPEKVFRLIDEQIRSVDWEKSDVLRACFEQLVRI